MGFWHNVFGRQAQPKSSQGVITRPLRTHLGAPRDTGSAERTQGKRGQAILADFPLVAEFHQSVNGESHYQPALRVAAGGRSAHMTGDNWESAIEVLARLVPEPANKYDGQAVAVQVDGRTVGYLPRDIAGEYQPSLLRLVGSGSVASCEGRIVGGGSRYYGIFLKMCGPGTIDFLRQLPPDVEPVCGMATVMVTGEEQHQDVLSAFHKMGADIRHLATLHSGTVPKGKHQGDYTVEVRMNGSRVGCLTAAMGQRYRTVVVRGETLGRVVGSMAFIRQDDRGLQVELLLPSARDLSD